MLKSIRCLRSTLLILCCLSFIVASLQANDKKTEPTNADEAAAKKAKQEAEINKKFAAWKATLPAKQQAWETVLEENLGGFYLPIYKKQKVAGQKTAWDYVADDPKLPRVLLIGDSVSRGYTQAARNALKGKANVHRAPANCGPTATGLKKLDVWLGDGNWDLIHFNFGIHDRRTNVDDYEKRLEEIVKRLKQTGAKVVWASSTPIPADWKEGPEMKAKLEEKNAIAAKVMERNGVEIDDLFTFITPHLSEVQNPKDVHFNGKGYDLLGKQVAEYIEGALQEENQK
ncbi:SGNH/GDSL hydrolase family protein [Gimesia chilikensis]|uniref:SGNH/GDSL hydrolase family protein n=1 Tax=Gimesia chilikensis TaxID=2605989 RepID=UPI0011F0179A|nr:SGNH/GDSL hydrolase family protein [Gimesia chilikensis]KAA0137368.1 SGNH/GDSL hydrolase family protein [Gimesia chilikensis]